MSYFNLIEIIQLNKRKDIKKKKKCNKNLRINQMSNKDHIKKIGGYLSEIIKKNVHNNKIDEISSLYGMNEDINKKIFTSIKTKQHSIKGVIFLCYKRYKIKYK